MFKRIFAPILLTAGLLGGTAAIASIPAHASQTEICHSTPGGSPDSPCMDEYNNGGGVVASYAPGHTYEGFAVAATGTPGYFEVVAPSGLCVGDYGNSKTSALAGDSDSCPSSGTAGWGTVFQLTYTGGPHSEFVLYNTHWSALLGGGVPNGSDWYLNTSGLGGYSQF